MTFVCPTSGMPRKGTLPAGISEDSLREAPNLATALKQVGKLAKILMVAEIDSVIKYCKGFPRQVIRVSICMEGTSVL